MTKVQQVKDSVKNFVWWSQIVGKVVMFQVALALMTAGVILFYQICTHSTLKFEYVPQMISPIVEVK